MATTADNNRLDPGFAQRIAAAAARDRYGIALDLVLTETAALLGQPPSEVDPDRAYRDYGYNSLAGLALTEQLIRSSGVELPLTMLFDQPNPAAVARYLLSRVEPAEVAAASAQDDALPERAQQESTRTDRDDIAVVGMACRYPGAVGSPEQLWRLVADGVDAITGFPDDRGWDLAALYHPDPGHQGTSYARSGGFLADATYFDPGFFGISPFEALATDPQQRLLLEGTWEALEQAGIDPASLRGSPTGVFVGACGADYSYHVRPGSAGLEGRWGLGTMGSVASGRVAYTFGFVGPALTVDTACSSALVAVHLAMQSLRRGECTFAVAGGVQVLATPSVFVEFSRQRGLAPDGRCKSFAAAADGTGLSEGLGVLLLERRSDAERNGHPILALLRGSAVNSDGASNGITAPNGPSQERVITAALADADLAQTDVDAVEAHGTGTTLGDPIEANALLATYGQQRPPDRPLWLGSVKSNIGHTQGAAGASGLIKMIMALQHETLPATLHVDAPTAKVDWTAGGVSLLTVARAWPRGRRPRRAGVSAFGVSGTNAHVIVEEAPSRPQPPPRTEDPHTPTVWILSARSVPALAAQARRLSDRIQADQGLHHADIGYTLATSRARLEYRAVVFGTTRAELLAGLDALACGADHGVGLVTGRVRLDGRSALALMFPGQGSQFHKMGTELAATYPVFAAALAAAHAELDRHLDRPLSDVVDGDSDATSALLDQTSYTQAALFAVEVALFRLLESWGVRASYLIGHSVGELSAAHVSGAITLADACALVAARAGLMQALPPGGAMVAVQASESEVAADLLDTGGPVAVAAVNGPSAVVLSGAEDAVLAAARRWSARAGRTRRLRVSHAFHSPLIEPMLAEFAQIAADVAHGAQAIPVVSNVTGAPVPDQEFATADYWVRHARGTVRFGDGIGWLAQAGVDTFVELGPGGALSLLARDCLADAGEHTTIVPTLRARRPESRTLLSALAHAYVAGIQVDWAATFAGRGAAAVALPTYPFQRQRYWVGPPAGDPGAPPAGGGLAASDHPLLSGMIELGDGGGWLFTGSWSVTAHRGLTDHTVFGVTVVAGATIVELAVSLARRVGAGAVAELTLEAPLLVPDDDTTQVQVRIGSPDPAGRSPLTVHSHNGEGWIRNASGLLSGQPDPLPAAVGWGTWPPEDAVALDLDGLYERLAARGLGYRGLFRGLRAAWRRGDELFAEVDPDRGADPAADTGHLTHPGLLDAALHAVFVGRVDDGDADSVWLPFVWSGIRLRPRADALGALRVRLTPAGANSVGLTAVDDANNVVVSVESVVGRPATPAQLAAARPVTADSLFRLNWTEIEATAAEPALASVVVLGDQPQTWQSRTRRYPDVAALVSDIERGAEPPDWVVVALGSDTPLGTDTASVPQAVASLVRRALHVIRQWLAADRLAATRLAFVTRGAAAPRGDETPDPAVAPLWGLVRSAQSEHPDLFTLVDIDEHAGSVAVMSALATGEPQVAVRGHMLFVPRLRPAPASAPMSWRGIDGVVLITGGTGGLGAVVAKHLVAAHQVRQLLLVSRRGAAAAGAQEVVAELTALGAAVEVAACDVSDREQVRRLLEPLRSGRRLRAVIHAAGVVDDGVIDLLTDDRLDRVLRPKVDAAWHLHELTADLDLAAFVLFSSAASAIGAPGQANYAAANAFLDALAPWRRARGLPAVSLAWGLWELPSAITRGMTPKGRARLAAGGVLELSERDGLRLFDRTVGTAEPTVLPVRLDRRALRALASAGLLPATLTDLVPVVENRAAQAGGALRERLGCLSAADREQELLSLVRTEVAAVLHYPGPDAVDPDRAFTELGFDSLGAVELRNRVSFETGSAVPTTVVFDYPTPLAVARYLRDTLFPAAASTAIAPAAEDAELDPAALDEIDAMDTDALVRLALRDNGSEQG